MLLLASGQDGVGAQQIAHGSWPRRFHQLVLRLHMQENSKAHRDSVVLPLTLVSERSSNRQPCPDCAGCEGSISPANTSRFELHLQEPLHFCLVSHNHHGIEEHIRPEYAPKLCKPAQESLIGEPSSSSEVQNTAVYLQGSTLRMARQHHHFCNPVERPPFLIELVVVSEPLNCVQQACDDGNISVSLKDCLPRCEITGSSLASYRPADASNSVTRR